MVPEDKISVEGIV
jgi:hypothetical protein